MEGSLKASLRVVVPRPRFTSAMAGGIFGRWRIPMPNIVTHLWFDHEAAEAARFYVGLFPDSRITSESKIGGTPSGDVDLLSFELAGSGFQAISAGPVFKINPAVSFLVACESREEVDRYWKALSPGGSELMPLGAYPFSEHYAWVMDRFGVSWQLMAMGALKSPQKITPTLMFTGGNVGRAEEAVRFYASLFESSSVGPIDRYGPGMEPDDPQSVKHGSFSLSGRAFAAMDSAHPHGFTFNEAISFMVFCETQAEIDHYWEGLSAYPEAERCGWLKDRFGFSWQIVPTALGRIMGSGDEVSRERATKAFLAMKKFDIAALERAAGGE